MSSILGSNYSHQASFLYFSCAFVFDLSSERVMMVFLPWEGFFSVGAGLIQCKSGRMGAVASSLHLWVRAGSVQVHGGRGCPFLGQEGCVSRVLLFYLFVMPPPLGTGCIMFSGCPSVRPKPEIPSFDLYMGPLVHPTNRNRFTACPSVRPSVCPSVRSVRPSVRPSIWRGFRALRDCMENAWRDLPEILHADECWPSSELIILWSWSVDSFNFGTILT